MTYALSSVEAWREVVEGMYRTAFNDTQKGLTVFFKF